MSTVAVENRAVAVTADDVDLGSSGMPRPPTQTRSAKVKPICCLLELDLGPPLYPVRGNGYRFAGNAGHASANRQEYVTRSNQAETTLRSFLAVHLGGEAQTTFTRTDSPHFFEARGPQSELALLNQSGLVKSLLPIESSQR